MKKKALLSSILSIMLCLSLITGSTFALFTSESKVNVAVTAGNVEVVATVENIIVSSTLGQNLKETSATFNSTDNTITLDKIVPGDVVSFDLRLTNNSDVTISYRTVISKVSDAGLWDGLKVTIDEAEYDGKIKRSEWAQTAPGSEDILVHVVVALPEEAGNEYRGTSCTLAYTIEAVQGNVDTNAIADDAADLSDILGSGEDVFLTNDFDFSANDTTANSGYGKTGLSVKGGTLNGNGHTVNVTNANSTWDCAIHTTGGIIKNLTVSGAMRGIFMGSATSDLLIDNVVFTDVIYTFNSDGGSKDYSVTIQNSTLYGWTSFSDVHKSVDFINCTFAEGNGYAFCRPYNATTFTNCVFEEGFEINARNNVIFNNCYYGDTLITSENISSLGLMVSTDPALVTVKDYTVVNGIYHATTSNGIDQAIDDGATTISLGKGNYIIPDSAQGKTLTIIGNGETVVATQDDGSYEGCDYSLDGATVTFENITINTDSATYTGYARLNATYNNCTINGTYTLYGNSEFNNCTFNVSGDVYNIWTWGAENATFNDCTFNSDGKALLLYGTVNTNLTVNGCTFNDNGGLPDLKAAIEIGNDYNKSYTLTVTDTVVNGYEINDKGISTGTTLWANKNSMSTDNLSVTVDGVKVY